MFRTGVNIAVRKRFPRPLSLSNGIFSPSLDTPIFIPHAFFAFIFLVLHLFHRLIDNFRFSVLFLPFFFHNFPVFYYLKKISPKYHGLIFAKYSLCRPLAPGPQDLFTNLNPRICILASPSTDPVSGSYSSFNGCEETESVHTPPCCIQSSQILWWPKRENMRTKSSASQ